MKKVTQKQVMMQVFGPETRMGALEIHNAAVCVREYFQAPSGRTPEVNWTATDKRAFAREVVKIVNGK